MQEEKLSKVKVLEALNAARSMELLSIIQYMHEHYTFSDIGYDRLANAMKKIAIAEMKHAEKFAERIKELGGEPTTFIADELFRGEDMLKNYEKNISLEDNALARYNQFVAVCYDYGDNVSARLFTDILLEEQEHYNNFTITHDHIKKLGTSYLVQQD